MTLSMNVIILLYLVASVFFIQALKGLSHPTTSRRGNTFGMVGMAIAIVTTVALVYKLAPQIATAGMGWVLLGLVVGGAVGTTIAFRVEMTKMPEMVAFMHSMIGLAAVFIAIAAVAEPWAFGIAPHGGTIPTGNRFELFIGAFVGAITFSGSASLSILAFPRWAAKRWSGFSRIVQVLKTSTSASSCETASPSPSSSSMPLIRSESWAFIWQPNVVTW